MSVPAAAKAIGGQEHYSVSPGVAWPVKGCVNPFLCMGSPQDRTPRGLETSPGLPLESQHRARVGNAIGAGGPVSG